jgi:hypothetical protein
MATEAMVLKRAEKLCERDGFVWELAYKPEPNLPQRPLSAQQQEEYLAKARAELDEPAKVFETRLIPGEWRVEWEDHCGEIETAIFSGPDAHERAISYAARQYCSLEDIGVSSYP